MEARKLVGPNAGSLKYDILTALSVAGMSGSQTFQTSMFRLISIITARYNWQLDELSVGQKALAKMWSVDERTVKREIKRLVDCGLLNKKRQGVRGRVSAYKLNYDEVWRVSRSSWLNVGEDFHERMTVNASKSDLKIVKMDFSTAVSSEPSEPTWRAVRETLRLEDPAAFQNWFSKLVSEGLRSGILTVRAPNAFIARYIESNLGQNLFYASKKSFPDIVKVKIVSA